MKQLFLRGKRIRPTDKDLVFHTALAALFPVFLLVVLLFHIRQIAGTNWQEVSLSQIAQDVNIPYLLFSMGVAGLGGLGGNFFFFSKSCSNSSVLAMPQGRSKAAHPPPKAGKDGVRKQVV